MSGLVRRADSARRGLKRAVFTCDAGNLPVRRADSARRGLKRSNTSIEESAHMFAALIQRGVD